MNFKHGAWFILLIPFALLTYFYNLLPNEMLIARSLFGGENILASKSLFTVFRVPLIELVCAFAIEVMRRKFAGDHPKCYLMWSLLLYTVALKSLFQSFELISSANPAKVFFYTTVGVVLVGIITAISVGRDCLLNFSSKNWKLANPEKVTLAVLLLMYLGFAIVPILAYR